MNTNLIKAKKVVEIVNKCYYYKSIISELKSSRLSSRLSIFNGLDNICFLQLEEKELLINYYKSKIDELEEKLKELGIENNSDTELKYLELAGPYKSKKRKYKRLPFIGVILLAMLIIAIIVIIVK